MDLNADLGEGAGDDVAMLAVVTSASVACGVHAGTPVTMLDTMRAAAARSCTIGAHPSYDDRDGFGRRDMEVAPDRLADLVAGQITALSSLAAMAGTRVAYVKPHGALYNRAARDAAVADGVIAGLRAAGATVILAPAASRLLDRARTAGLTAVAEAFADRAYLPDGRLAPRSQPGSVLHDPAEVARRAVGIAVDGAVEALDGTRIELHAASLCVHGDTPGAAAMARAVRRALEDAGVAIRAFAL